MLGAVDGMVLERLAKIMSYMRPSERGKNSKKLRKKDKLAMLNGHPPEPHTNGSYANGHAGDAAAGPDPPAIPLKVQRHFHQQHIFFQRLYMPDMSVHVLCVAYRSVTIPPECHATPAAVQNLACCWLKLRLKFVHHGASAQTYPSGVCMSCAASL